MMTFLLSLLFVLQAFAQETFGPEFEFTNAEIHADPGQEFVDSESAQKFRDLLANRVKNICDGCVVTNVSSKYGVLSKKVTYPDGFWFIISTDPATLEIQAKPMSIADMERLQPRIQRDLFDTAKELGLKPGSDMKGDEMTASGHIHIGFKEYFQGNLTAFRDFLVDYANHSELATGILAEDYPNARPIGALAKTRQARFRALIKEIDDGKIKTIDEVVTRLNESIYDKAFLFWGPSEKYQAFNVVRLNREEFNLKEMTIEIRGIRGQRSFEEFVMLSKMFDARIRHLKAQNERVKVELLDPRKMTLQEKALRFHAYVTESGLDFAPYLKFLPKRTAEALLKKVSVPGASTVRCENVFDGIAMRWSVSKPLETLAPGKPKKRTTPSKSKLPLSEKSLSI